MAAPTVRALGTQATMSGAGALVLTVPTNANGDLLVASIRVDASVPGNIDTPAGWTYLSNIGTSGTGTDFNAYIFWRIASSEPADYTFNFTGGSDAGIGRIVSVQSVNTLAPINTSSASGDSTAGTAVVGATMTPTVADTLIMMFVTNNGAATTSAYALATDSPTFTEQYDVTGINTATALATGPRAATTATGNITATLSASQRWAVQTLAVAPIAVAAGDNFQMGANF